MRGKKARAIRKAMRDLKPVRVGAKDYWPVPGASVDMVADSRRAAYQTAKRLARGRP